MAAEEEPAFDATAMAPLPAPAAAGDAADGEAGGEAVAVEESKEGDEGHEGKEGKGGKEGKEGGAKRKKKGKKEGWKEVAPNTSVYITGLPPDVTPGTLQAHFAHCGALKRDLDAKPKLKIYMDADGRPKGDARLTFARPESVALAKLLDESWFDQRHQLRVAEATFRPKEDFVPPEARFSAQELAKRKKLAATRTKALFSGSDEETRRHVILKNVFSLNDVPPASEASARFFRELKEDFSEECGKFGDVESVKIFERNPLGVVAIKFRAASGAVRCLEVLEGRFFGGRKLSAEWYDGYSNYNVQESEADQKRRVDEFGKWLEGDGPDAK